MKLLLAIAGLDRLWSMCSWNALYAYDQVDFTVQNSRSVPGMEHYGLIRQQVDIVKRFGSVEEIEVWANPGHLMNADNLYWSVQWVNYWSMQSQVRMFGSHISALPDWLQLDEVAGGAVRVRLSESPGKLDDVDFHERQMACRRLLPFDSIFRLSDEE